MPSPNTKVGITRVVWSVVEGFRVASSRNLLGCFLALWVVQLM